MIDIGIYSTILKWGLETATGLVKDKDPQNIQIVIEAIKLRNSIILKRFDFCEAAAQEVVALVDEVETELATLAGDIPPLEKKAERLAVFIKRVGDELHPRFVRRLKLVRSKFSATNDLSSAYSIEFLVLLDYKNIKSMFKSRPATTVTEAARLYRQMWHAYCGVMQTIIRISSSDVRFWATDISYFRHALRQARVDRINLQKFYLSSTNSEPWILDIEDHEKVRKFWAQLV